MNERESFYVTLDSNKTKEFPNDTSSSFKKRLPVLLDLTKPGWKVGLHSILLPTELNQSITLSAISGSTILVTLRWLHQELDDYTRKEEILDIPKSTLLPTTKSMSPMELMQLIIEQYQNKKFNDAIPDDHFVTYGTHDVVNLNRMEIVFKWLPNGNLLIDNSETRLLTYNVTPTLKFHVLLAVNMGWLVYEKGKYKLGPNLRYSTQVYNYDYYVIRPPLDMNEILRVTGQGGTTTEYWVIVKNYLFLSVAVNWTVMLQDKTELVRVYSNVTESSIINDGIASLLAEVNYKREETGLIRPLQHHHIRYNHLRQALFEFISIVLLNVHGEPVHITGSPTSITLHFKCEPCQISTSP